MNLYKFTGKIFTCKEPEFEDRSERTRHDLTTHFAHLKKPSIKAVCSCVFLFILHQAYQMANEFNAMQSVADCAFFWYPRTLKT